MSISCVIVTKNRPESVQRLLNSIAAQDEAPLEIILVNDGGESSPYSSGDIPLVVIENKDSVGSGRARNLGVEHSQSPLILLLDDDVELIGSDFISQGLKAMSTPKTGLAFPRKIDVIGHRSFELSFFAENQWTGELRKIPQNKMDNKNEGRGEVEGIRAPLLGPMVTFIRRHAFEEVGGYDSIFGWGRGHSFREESDFQLRVQRKGWGAAILKDSFFKHHIQVMGGHGPHLFKKLFWIGHNQVVFGSRHQKNWLRKAVFFAGLELPRYSWGNGRLLTSPAGLLGWSAGLATSLIKGSTSRQKR